METMKVTNYDVVTNYDIDSLAEFINNFCTCNICHKNANTCQGRYCENAIKKWLGRKAKITISDKREK